MERPIPAGFVEMIKRVEGIDSDALIASLDTPPGVSLRYNIRKATPDEMTGMYEDMSVVEWCPEGRRLSVRPKFTLNPLLHAGVFYVQDASSMVYSAIVSSLVVLLSDDVDGRTSRPLRVLDFCAAPGGKTTAMVNALPDDAQLVANEYDPRRGNILRENLEKWGFGNVIMTGDDAGAYGRLTGIFDIVAIDAPCSGEGMMRKDEDARAQWSERLVGQCARLQRDILDNVSRCVRPGGYMIYSTCTFNTAEDEDNARYIRDVLGFEPVELPLRGVEQAARGVGEGHLGLRFMPHLTEGEGLYVCVFRRPSDDEVTTPLKPRDSRRMKGGRHDNSVKGLKAPDWLSPDVDM
ncbi:MAG: RsmB/NOP family class I SAM-dependent RNA methyltransferase, partial [Muribaculaceae bacterium]|nr:RsmB/NOP family class I SAM-dependent RNA methyltransferase [Muribaculaceae bacterium]